MSSDVIVGGRAGLSVVRRARTEDERMDVDEGVDVDGTVVVEGLVAGSSSASLKRIGVGVVALASFTVWICGAGVFVTGVSKYLVAFSVVVGGESVLIQLGVTEFCVVPLLFSTSYSSQGSWRLGTLVAGVA